jgi:hypothetical protein
VNVSTRTAIALLVAFACCLAGRGALAGDARARFPQGDAYVGVPFVVTVDVVDAQEVSPPVAPEIPGASVRVAERGRQQSMQLINGRISRSTTVTYAVEIVPERPGELAIPAMEVRVDGVAMRTEARTVNVRPSDAADLLAAEVFGQPPEVSIGEPLDLVLRVAVKPYRDPRYGALNELQMWQFVDLKGSEWGIFAPEIAELVQRGSAPRVQREARGDEEWYVYEVTRRTWPPKSGMPDIGEVRVRMTYPMELREVPGFMLDRELRVTQSRPVSVAAQPTGIEVLPLPEEGRPASFAGAVGTFSMAATAKPTEVAAGDPITVTLAITDEAGTANMESLQPPPLAGDAELARDFRVPNEAISGVVSGRTKRFTLTLRPLRAGIASIPALEFSSFDPKARRYGAVRSAPIPITVVPGSSLDLARIVSAGGAAAPAPEGAGLRSAEGGLVANLPVSEAMLADDRPRLGASGLAMLAVPPALAAAAVAWRMRRDRHARDGSIARRASARRRAEQRLAAAADAAAVAGAVTGFVEDATGRAPGTLTRGDLDAALAAAGTADGVRDRARELLARCDRARYAGGAGADPAIADEARAVLEALDASGLRTKGNRR